MIVILIHLYSLVKELSFGQLFICYFINILFFYMFLFFTGVERAGWLLNFNLSCISFLTWLVLVFFVTRKITGLESKAPLYSLSVCLLFINFFILLSPEAPFTVYNPYVFFLIILTFQKTHKNN